MPISLRVMLSVHTEIRYFSWTLRHHKSIDIKIVTTIRWAGNVARMGHKRYAYRISFEIPVRKCSLSIRRRHIWDDNIKTGLKNGIKEHGLNKSGLEWGRVAGCCEHGNEPLSFTNAEICFGRWATVSFSRTLLHGVTMAIALQCNILDDPQAGVSFGACLSNI
jgi:hypothetical protein